MWKSSVTVAIYQKIMIISVDGLAISNIDIVTGEFECSNPLINKLQHNIRWGEIGQFSANSY